ncbi:MAG: hypothetical protein Kow0081_4750 [Candidatus Dojkabacteria bacterium]
MDYLENRHQYDGFDIKGEFKTEDFEKRGFPKVIETTVAQNEFKEQVIYTSDDKAYLLHTVGRIGCDACLLLTIESDGTEHVVVTHFDPIHDEEHVKLIREKTYSHPKGQRKAVLVTRGADNDEWRHKLCDALRGYLGDEEPDVVSLPHLDVEHARELAEPFGYLNYQLCYTRGYGGDRKKHRVNVPKGGNDVYFESI